MPTNKRRYTITETGPVADALQRYRAAGHADAVTNADVAELVVAGVAAELRAAEARDEDAARRRALRERFLERSSTGAGVDLTALDEATNRWTH